MATQAAYQEIATTSRSLLQVLLDARSDAGLAGLPCDLYQAQNFRTPMSEGISLYLFRVVANRTGRVAPEFDRNNARLRPPVFVDLSYLLTAWGQQAERQQHLLAWAIRTLEDLVVLPGAFLNSCSTDGEPFRADQTLEVAPEPLVMADLVNVWEVAKNNPQPSIAYVVRAVPIRSRLAEATAGPVRVREPQVAVPQ